MKIIGSVCDQTATNAGAVNKLAYPGRQRVVQEGQLISYAIDGNTIIHCFDPPHILKVIRNNLQSKDLIHSISDVWNYKISGNEPSKNIEKTASWNDVKQFYDIQTQNMSGLLRKITDEHVNPKKLKMKVYVAAQVFSNTYGNTMMYCSKMNHLARDFSGTAHFLIFINNLFDSMNGGCGKSPVNPLRSAIDKNNKKRHFEFWTYAISELEKMNFVDKDSGKVNNCSSVLKKTISTIKGYMELTTMCLSLGVQSISLRRMNQDGLENFFGNVKAVCYSPKQPMPFQFRSAFTVLIVTGLTAKHSQKSNCQDDKSTALLQNVYEFYDMDFEHEEEVDDDEDIIELDVIVEEETDSNLFEAESLIWESGKVCKNVLSRIKCQECVNTVEAYRPLTQHGIIQQCDANSGQKDSLFTYPTVLFMDVFRLLSKEVDILLPFICHEQKLLAKLVSSLNSCSMESLGCEKHSAEVSLQIKRETAKYRIYQLTKQVNNIFSKKTTEVFPFFNEIHKKAFKVKGIGKQGQSNA